MTDKAIVICVMLAALTVIAVAFVRRAMRYRKALGAAVPESEPIPEVEMPPEPPIPVTHPTPKRQEHREPSGRKRGFPSYRDVFVVRNEIKHRQCVYISHEVHSLISSLVRMLVDGGGEITVGGYIDKVLYEHLQAYKDEINDLYRNGRPELLK
jgi:hypothetical protein